MSALTGRGDARRMSGDTRPRCWKHPRRLCPGACQYILARAECACDRQTGSPPAVRRRRPRQLALRLVLPATPAPAAPPPRRARGLAIRIVDDPLPF